MKSDKRRCRKDVIIFNFKLFRLPHTIGEASIDAYNELMNMDERSKAKLEYENGEIIIVEFPTRPHERAIGEIERQVTNALYDSHDFLSSRSTS